MAQDIELREKPVATEKESIFQPISATSADGILSIRASGSYKWNVTPIIGQKWNGSEKSLVLAIEVVGENLQPSTAVFVIDGKTVVIPSSDWQVDSRGHLVAWIKNEGLVRSLAKAEEVSITVFAPGPLTNSFHAGDLGVFRSMVQIYDAKAMHPSEAEEHPVSDLGKAPVTLITPPSEKRHKQTSADRGTFLESKVEEAASICHDEIINNSKDPFSVEFLGDYSYAFGRTILFRNWIFVYWETMGRNTYGAVLRHSMTCTVSCTQDKGCTWINLDDKPL